MPKDNIFILQSGNILELSEEEARIAGNVPVGAILVDGLGVGDVGNVVLRDRQRLAEDGIVVVVAVLDSQENVLINGPDVISRGFVYARESEDVLDEAQSIAYEAIDKCLMKGISDWGKIKSVMRDDLSDHIWKTMKRRPMILPILIEG